MRFPTNTLAIANLYALLSAINPLFLANHLRSPKTIFLQCVSQEIIMHKLFTGLCVALLSIQSVAMDKDHHKTHHHQSNSFVTVEVDGLVLSKFRARASIGQMKNSGAYGEIQSNTYDRLIQASSSVAAVVELHEHINDDGIMRMRKVKGGLALEPNQSMIMKPGGYHIMLISLHKPLKAGDTMDLSLKFGSGKLIELSIPVVSIKKSHH